MSKFLERGKETKAKNNIYNSDSRVARIEKETRISFKDVRIHYESQKPKEFDALAYTYGNDVYLGPNQEMYLSHELGHVLQQRQGIVRGTAQMNGYAINTDEHLEKQANSNFTNITFSDKPMINNPIIQRAVGFEFQMLKSKVSGIDEKKDPYKGRFKTIIDGNNIEMVTYAPLSNEGDLQIIIDMAQKAAEITASGTTPIHGITFSNGHISDGLAQPQVNVDIPVAAAENIDQIYKSAGAMPAYQGNDFYWKADITNATIQESIKFAESVRQVFMSTYQSQASLQKIVISPEMIPSLIGLIQLICTQYVQKNSEFLKYKRSENHLDKDIPILIKTNFQSLISTTLKVLNIKNNEKEQYIHFLRALTNLCLKTSNDDFAKAGIFDDIIDPRKHLYVNQYFNKIPLPAKSDADGVSALAEFRRFPSLPFTDWFRLAKDCLNILGNLNKWNSMKTTQTKPKEKKSNKKITKKRNH